jgi:hypothetical protein
MDKIEGPKKRRYIPGRPQTPEPDDDDDDGNPMDWTCAPTP